MNETVNNFLLPGDTFMPKILLREIGFRYRACRPFTKKKERTPKFK